MCCVTLWRVVQSAKRRPSFFKDPWQLQHRFFEGAGLHPSQTASTDSWDSIRATLCSLGFQM